MHAKYQVSILMAQKLWPMLKLVTNRQTDKQTGQKQYAPHILSGGHKNMSPTSTPHYKCIYKISLQSGNQGKNVEVVRVTRFLKSRKGQ